MNNRFNSCRLHILSKWWIWSDVVLLTIVNCVSTIIRNVLSEDVLSKEVLSKEVSPEIGLDKGKGKATRDSDSFSD